MDKDIEAFETFCRRVYQLRGPYLRDCNNIEPDREYQDFETQALWEQWKAGAREWQPIETAPRDGTSVILCVTGTPYNKTFLGKHYIYFAAFEDGRWSYGDTSYESKEWSATHWMPLPNPPIAAGIVGAK